MGERFGFAGAGARDYQKRPYIGRLFRFDTIFNGLSLLCVQVIEVIKVHNIAGCFPDRISDNL